MKNIKAEFSFGRIAELTLWGHEPKGRVSAHRQIKKTSCIGAPSSRHDGRMSALARR